MADRVWIGADGGDWADPANWQGTIVPGPGDDVTIQSTLAETITISTTDTIASLTVSDPAASFDILNAGTIVVSGDATIHVLTATIEGTIVSGGNISITAVDTIDVAGGLDAPHGLVSLFAGTEVTTNGTLTGSEGSLQCFAAGTCIETANGPIPVENLAEGDEVRLIGGGTAPIVWIGRRRIDLLSHPKPERVSPVRIAPNAFGLGRPYRPLRLSPDHAVFVEGVLIPVKFLLNGSTITQTLAAAVTYYHVELAHHDVVLAEGLPVETYLETGSRSAFENGDGVIQLHADFSPNDAAVDWVWEAKGYAPLLGRAGELDRVRRNLAAQAASLGYVAASVSA